MGSLTFFFAHCWSFMFIIISAWQKEKKKSKKNKPFYIYDIFDVFNTI